MSLSIEFSRCTRSFQLRSLSITLKDSLASASSVSVSIKRTMHGCVKIVPVCANGELPDEQVLSDVLAACSSDDVRPLTDKVIVEAPDTENYDIELTYYTSKNNESEAMKAIESAGGAIDQYINWQSSSLEQDINPDYLKKLILMAGAERVEIVKPEYTELGKTTIAVFSGDKKISHIVKG